MKRDTQHSTLTHEINMLKTDFKYYITMNHKIKHKLSEAIQAKDIDKIHYFSKLLKYNRSMIKAYTERLYNTKHKRSQHQREKKFYELRMYSLVDNYLKPLQVGVQSLHAEVEYSNQYGNTSDYYQWSRKDKTVIILNGGNYPDMLNNCLFLTDNDVKYAYFREPDHNNNITAIAFLADERVWNTEKYPGFDDFNNLIYQCFAKPQMKENWAKRTFNTSVEEAEQLMRLREFIFSKRLAQ